MNIHDDVMVHVVSVKELCRCVVTTVTTLKIGQHDQLNNRGRGGGGGCGSRGTSKIHECI